MKKCSNCGAIIDESSTSCAICGASTNEEDFYSIYGIPKPSTNKNEHSEKEQKAENTSDTENTQSSNNVQKVTPIKISDKNNKDMLNKAEVQKNNTDIKNNETTASQEVNDNKSDISANVSNIKQAVKLHKPKEDKNATAEIEIQQEQTDDEINSQKIEYTEIKEEHSFREKLIALLSPVKKIFFNTKDETASYDLEDIEENCHFALISYLTYFFFVPMIVKPYSGYLRFHGNQGLNLVLFATGFEIVNVIINSILGMIFTVNGALNSVGTFLTVLITLLINLTILLWITIGIANAVKGKARELPIIGRFRILK